MNELCGVWFESIFKTENNFCINYSLFLFIVNHKFWKKGGNFFFYLTSLPGFKKDYVC